MFSYNIANESNVTLEMFDLTGKQVGFKNQGNTYEGNYHRIPGKYS